MVRELGSPMTWLPQSASIAERSTGRTMGYHADLMAEINSVRRLSAGQRPWCLTHDR